MTHREIHTTGLMMDSGFPGAAASSLERAARIDVCLPISRFALKHTQTHAHGEPSKTQLRRSGETYPMMYASLAPSLARGHFLQYCKRDSIPI